MTMTMSLPATRVVGEVEWSKGASAGIRPLMNQVNGRWLTAEGSDYPPEGKVFWTYATNPEPRTLLAFTAVEGNGKDRFIVNGVLDAHPVLDLYDLNYADAMNLLRAGPVPAPGPIGNATALCVLCADGLLLGPLSFDPAQSNHLRFLPEQSKLDMVPFRRDTDDLIALPDGRMLALPLERQDGHLDCRSDAEVLKTALEKALKFAKESGIEIPDFVRTKRHIREIAAVCEGPPRGDRTCIRAGSHRGSRGGHRRTIRGTR